MVFGISKIKKKFKMNIRPFTGTSRTINNEQEKRSISNNFLGKIMALGKD